MTSTIDVSVISEDELSNIAGSFLEKYGSLGQTPIDIEKICDDADIGLLIVPNLTSIKNTEAYIADKCEAIVIDQNVFETQIDRARFSIAHELSHRILHSVHLENFPIHDLDSYDRFHEVLSADSLTIIEDQAYSLAGHLLMPTALLNQEINQRLAAENAALISDSGIQKIIRALATLFMVSVDALIRQIKKVNYSFYERISKSSLEILVPPYIKPSAIALPAAH